MNPRVASYGVLGQTTVVAGVSEYWKQSFKTACGEKLSPGRASGGNGRRSAE